MGAQHTRTLLALSRDADLAALRLGDGAAARGAALVRPHAHRPRLPRRPRQGQGLLTEATAMYRKIGMPKHLGMAEALLREL